MSKVYDVRQYVGFGKIPEVELPGDCMVVMSWNEYELLHSSVNTSTWFVVMWNEDRRYLHCSGTWIECASYLQRVDEYSIGWEDAPFKWGEPIANPTGATTYTPFWTSDETGEEYISDDGFIWKQYKFNYRMIVSTKPINVQDNNPDQDIKDHNNVIRFESYSYDNLIDLVKDIETYTDLTF